MLDERTKKMAQFYEQCQEKGYTDMADETQSLKAKVIATDLGLSYGKIANLFIEAEKAHRTVREEEERATQEAKRRAVDGELLVSLFESKYGKYYPTDEGENRIDVFRRPDGSVYSTYNNGPKKEGSPRLELVHGGYESFDMDSVGNLTKKKVKTDKGYITVTAGKESFEVGLIESSKRSCEAFKRDPEFLELKGESILFWNYGGKQKADYLRSLARSSGNYGNLAASAVGMNSINQAEDEMRLTYSNCKKILHLLERILKGDYPPSDEELYEKACRLSTLKSFPELKDSYETFLSISNYKDAKEKAEILRPKYEELLQEEKERKILEAEKRKKPRCGFWPGAVR